MVPQILSRRALKIDDTKELILGKRHNYHIFINSVFYIYIILIYLYTLLA